MSNAAYQFLSQDLPACLTAVFAVLACALLGNFLVLRRLSLMGDAISHSVLPGLVAGFLVVGSRGRLPMFLGAGAAGVVTVVLVEAVRKLGRLEAGAAMGAVFAVMFALGVLLIEQVGARGVDLDPDCVFNGQLENILWLFPREAPSPLTRAALEKLPPELWTTGALAIVAALFVSVFFKELRITSFDPALATSLGISARAMHFALMLLVAAAVVASFEAVGSILVIAMLICPPATARLLTDRLSTQVWLSAIIAVLVAVGGYTLAATAPVWLNAPRALSAAGMMTVLAGVFMAAAILGSPGHGVIARALRHRRLAADIAREDLLALLYRLHELGRPAASGSLTGDPSRRRALGGALAAGEVSEVGTALRLTDSGLARARSIIRAHRLWEDYLVRQAGFRPDHVHERAEALEHLTGTGLSDRLAEGSPGVTDPHGREIPRPPTLPG
ncbi:MAG: iron chelate uptake ABC transporter family permease subunit [Phycisphaerales bacterium]